MAASRSPHARPGREAERQGASGIVPCHLDAHPLTLAVTKRTAVVFIKQERSVRTGIDRDGGRLVGGLAGVLLHRTHRDDRPGTRVERRGLEIDGASDLAAAFLTLSGPEIEPCPSRQIDLARGRALCDYGGHEQVATPKIFVSSGHGSRIVG